MAFTRIRTINGRQYLYSEERWREGGKVRSRSVSLGPVSGGGDRSPGRKRKIDWAATLASPPAGRFAGERSLAQEQEHHARNEHTQEKALGDLHAKFGLSVGPANPAPVDKPAASVEVAAPSAAPAADNSAPFGQEGASPDGEAGSQ